MQLAKAGERSRGGLPCVVWIGLLALLVVFGAAALYWARRVVKAYTIDRTTNVLAFLRQPADHQDWMVHAGQRCAAAPFSMPTDGFIGYLWGDLFKLGNDHQGLDIFAGTDVNVTPVYVAYPGYLTRQAEWKSSVIIRIPDDPLSPGRQIWTYYTHMAGPDGDSFISEQFPPGTQEMPVEAGTLLGYQGNFSGTPGNPVGVHLHFSIVQDDGQGGYLNELDKDNTLDPSPYLGLPLNASKNQGEIPVCP